MIQKIKKIFLKKELEKIYLTDELATDKYNRQVKVLKRKEEQIKELEEKIHLEEANLKKKQLQDFKIYFIQQINENLKALDNIIDYDLLPGNKVWTLIPYSNEIKELKIISITITETNIHINNDGYFGENYFKTKKDAIKIHNKLLDKLKIN